MAKAITSNAKGKGGGNKAPGKGFRPGIAGPAPKGGGAKGAKGAGGAKGGGGGNGG